VDAVAKKREGCVEPDGISTDQDADLEALELVRLGDESGAARLFQRWSVPLLRFTGRMLGNASEAEEVTQDVFLKVIVRAGQYDGRASVASWLFAIAANACRDRLRQGARRQKVSLDSVAEAAGPDVPVDVRLVERQRRASVRRALAHLSDEQREVLVLARYHGLPYAEIARSLSISEGAVKTRIFRAMETLKSVFSEGDSPWNAASP
jgi:RNA polymerase sigma-70 factor (ECF subfamily)